MSTSEPATPITPTTPRTPSFPSIPSLLIRTTSQRTNTSTTRRNSSITSFPPATASSPMELDTRTVISTWPRRESIREESVDHNDDNSMDGTTCVTSPILDRCPSDAFTRTRTRAQDSAIASTPQPTLPKSYFFITNPQPPAAALTPYAAAVSHIARPLVPLISVTTGQPHPQFPTTLLHYHLLTHPQLDDLSVHYHQTEPATEESWRYPVRVRGWVGPQGTGRGIGGGSGRKMIRLPLDTKRRRFGRFIGLRGCESPVDVAGAEEGGEGERQEEREEGVEERMEREWQRQLERRREEERLREKNWRGAW